MYSSSSISVLLWRCFFCWFPKTILYLQSIDYNKKYLFFVSLFHYFYWFVAQCEQKHSINHRHDYPNEPANPRTRADQQQQDWRCPLGICSRVSRMIRSIKFHWSPSTSRQTILQLRIIELFFRLAVSSLTVLVSSRTVTFHLSHQKRSLKYILRSPRNAVFT